MLVGVALFCDVLFFGACCFVCLFCLVLFGVCLFGLVCFVVLVRVVVCLFVWLVACVVLCCCDVLLLFV